MATSRELWKIAQQIANSTQSEVAQLEKEIFDLEDRLAKAKAKSERDAARLAPKRLGDYQVKSGIDYQCPRCWILHEARAPLRPTGGAEDHDSFRCHRCDTKFTVPIFN